SDGLRGYVSLSRNVFEKWRGAGDMVRDHLEAKLRQELPNGSVTLNAYMNQRDDHDFLDITLPEYLSGGRSQDLSETYVVLADKEAQALANSVYFDAWSNGRTDHLFSANLETRPSG